VTGRAVAITWFAGRIFVAITVTTLGAAVGRGPAALSGVAAERAIRRTIGCTVIATADGGQRERDERGQGQDKEVVSAHGQTSGRSPPAANYESPEPGDPITPLIRTPFRGRCAHFGRPPPHRSPGRNPSRHLAWSFRRWLC